MIRATRAWVDSEGVFHQTREDACKAEFRRLLLAHFEPPSTGLIRSIDVDRLVEDMFELDKMIGEATKEDTRVEMAPAKPEGGIVHVT